MLRRWIFLAILTIGITPAAPPPAQWVPLRWEGGPLEILRRAQPEAEAPAAIDPELLLQAYQPDALQLLEDAPFNCLLLTWSLGAASEADAEQRAAVAALARAAREKGFAALGVVSPGPDWEAAVRAAAEAGLDGVALDGPFHPEQSLRAAEILAGRGAVVTFGKWQDALALPDPPIRAGGDGVWPALLTAEDDTDAFQSGPTKNPWVVANAWRVDALRADRSGRPVWSTHRPKRYRKQPLVAADYVRAVADTAMAGGRWAVTLDGEWQAGLIRGDPDKLEGWRAIAAAAAFFEAHADWRALQPQAALAVAYDPVDPDQLSGQEVLNLLAVRHVPHRLVLRRSVAAGRIPPAAQALTFDFAPSDAERAALKAFAQGGGIVFTGPRWASAGVELGLPAPAGDRGGVLAYADAKIDEDRFATDLRRRLDESGRAIRIFNTGTLMSFYTETEAGDRAVLHLTEHSDYPTDNVTVRLPKPIQKAVWTTLAGEEEELQVYDTEGGGEVVIPEVPGYGALTVDFEARR